MVLSRAIIITATDVVASTSTPSSDTGNVSCADDVELGIWSWGKMYWAPVYGSHVVARMLQGN